MTSDLASPSTYSKRDLLLLLQLLHTANLIEPSEVEEGDLDDISYKWFHHKSTQLSRSEGLGVNRSLTKEEIVQLYRRALEQYEECGNTTQLANAIYHERVAELERKLEGSHEQFQELLGESQ